VISSGYKTLTIEDRLLLLFQSYCSAVLLWALIWRLNRNWWYRLFAWTLL